MTTLPEFNFIQNVFTLNMFSNFASGKKAPAPQLQKDLGKILTTLFADTDIREIIGTWEVVWGPVVGSYGIDVKRQAASNAMYVARNQDGQYVIAVSATNPTSLYGWCVEDFEVHTMLAWNGSEQAGADAPRISQGTFDGLNHLLAMEYSKPGEVPLTLLQFLKATFSDSTNHTQIVVSGHSLGGALAPVLALYIDEAQNTWNLSKTIVVSTMPTAGASPGNKAFSNYQNNIMGSRTLRFWNSLDPVPHGWQPDTVELVPFLYYPYIKPGILFKAIAGLVLAQSLEGTAPYPQGGFYTPLQPQVPPLPGQVNLAITNNLSGAQIVQMFVDADAGKILKKLGVGGITATLIVDALNWVLNKFDNQEDLDTIIAKLEDKLNSLPHSAEIEKLLLVLKAILGQLQNIATYLTQLAFQHVTSYPHLMGTSQLHPLTQAIINNLVSSGQIGLEYKNAVDKMNNPVLQVQQMAGALGLVIEPLLTPEFVKLLL